MSDTLIQRPVSTRISKIIPPQYRKKKSGDLKEIMQSIGFILNTDSDINKQSKQAELEAHKINIRNVRHAVAKDEIKKSSSPKQIQQAKKQAELKYRKEYGVLDMSDDRIDYNEKDLFAKRDGQYLRDEYGNFILNPNRKKTFSEKAASALHNTMLGAATIASLVPNPISQAASRAVFGGMSASDALHDIKDGNYGMAAVDVASNFIPEIGKYGSKYINKFYKPYKKLKTEYLLDRFDTSRFNSMKRLRKELDNKSRLHRMQIENKVVSRLQNSKTEDNLIFASEEAKKYFLAKKTFRSGTKTIDINGSPVQINFPMIERGVVSSPKKSGLEPYRNEIEQMLNGSGLVGGSTRLYTSGFTSGIPHDLEILTTKSRLEDVRKAIGAKNASYGEDNGFRLSLEGSPKIYNSDGGHMVDVQYIGEDLKGFANGLLAHNYYSRLFPNKYKLLLAQWEKQAEKAINDKKRFVTVELPLPIKAEELYQILQKHPNIYDHLVAMDNFNGYKNKHVARLGLILQDPRSKRIIDANERALFNDKLPELSNEGRDELLSHFGFDPSSMKDDLKERIAKLILMSYSKSTRTVFKKDKTWNTELENNALLTTVAPYNGQSAGIGGNTVLNSSVGGIDGDVTAALLNNTEITTYKDLLDIIQNQKLTPVYHEFNALNRVAEKTNNIQDVVEQTEQLAKKYGVHGFVGDRYGFGIYYGQLRRPKIGLKAYTSNANSGSMNLLEAGATPKHIGNEVYEHLGLPDLMNFTKHLINVRDAVNGVKIINPIDVRLSYKRSADSFENFIKHNKKLSPLYRSIKSYDDPNGFTTSTLRKLRNAKYKYDDLIRYKKLGGMAGGVLSMIPFINFVEDETQNVSKKVMGENTYYPHLINLDDHSSDYQNLMNLAY